MSQHSRPAGWTNDQRPPRRWVIVTLAILIALDVGKHALIFASGQPPLVFDALEYWKLGEQLKSGDYLLAESGFAYRTPGYPLLIAAGKVLFDQGALLAVVVLQHLLVIATSLAIAMSCWVITGRSGAALFAYVLAMASLVRASYANCLLTESLFTFLLTAHILLVLLYHRLPTSVAALASGGTLGVATLVRPISLLLWIPIGFTFFLKRGQIGGARRLASHLFLFLLALSLLLTPWIIRNWHLFGSPFYTQFVGRAAWVVCFPQDPAEGLDMPETPAMQRVRALLRHQKNVDLRNTWSVSPALVSTGLSDAETDQLMARVCRDAILAQPGKYLQGFLQRFATFWYTSSELIESFERYADPSAAQAQPRLKLPWAVQLNRLLMQLAPSRRRPINVLYALGAWGGAAVLLLHHRTRPMGMALALTMLTLAVLTVTLQPGLYRYRLVLEPLMIISISSGGAVFWRWLTAK